jgi:hypothetical protein
MFSKFKVYWDIFKYIDEKLFKDNKKKKTYKVKPGKKLIIQSTKPQKKKK